MTNSVVKNIDRFSATVGDNLAYAGFLTIVFYGVGIADRDAGAVAGAVGAWALFYGLFAPYLVRSIAIREPAGDTWRAAAWVAYGALPFAPYIPFWDELTAWPASIATYPVVVVWSVGALILASLSRRMSGSPKRRAAFLGLAGAILAIGAGPIYVGFVVAGYIGLWTPPDGEHFLMLLAMLGGAPIAWLAGWAAIELLGRANRIEPEAAEAG